MDKNQNYYQNKNKYGDLCVPRRGGLLNYLIKERFLSEFSTEEEKLQVLENLGITSRLKLLQQNVNNKADMSLLRRYVTEVELIRRLDALKPKDEKSKGYFASYEELIQAVPNGSRGDWAIVNNEGAWFVYNFKDNGWVQGDVFQTDLDLSEYAKLADLEFFQELLVSGANIKTINGQTILGEGDLEIKEPVVTENNDGLMPKELYVDLLVLLNRVVPGLQEQVEQILNDTHLEEELDALTERFETLLEQVETNTEDIANLKRGEGLDLSNYVTKEELFDIQNPLKASMSVSPTLIEYTGETKNISITCTARKGNTVVTPSSIELSYRGNTVNIDGTYVAEIQQSGVTTFSATLHYKNETATCSGSVNITLPTYIGFSSAETAETVNLQDLTKKIVSGLTMTETLQNNVSGNYLWIVSPYNLQKVATDQGFIYEVKMVSMNTIDGLKYYRSNSALDISNLTYYIK